MGSLYFTKNSVTDGEGEIGGKLKVESLNDMDAEVTALEGKLSKAREIKQGMMSVLLTGKVRLVESR